MPRRRFHPLLEQIGDPASLFLCVERRRLPSWKASSTLSKLSQTMSTLRWSEKWRARFNCSSAEGLRRRRPPVGARTRAIWSAPPPRSEERKQAPSGKRPVRVHQKAASRARVVLPMPPWRGGARHDGGAGLLQPVELEGAALELIDGGWGKARSRRPVAGSRRVRAGWDTSAARVPRSPRAVPGSPDSGIAKIEPAESREVRCRSISSNSKG